MKSCNFSSLTIIRNFAFRCLLILSLLGLWGCPKRCDYPNKFFIQHIKFTPESRQISLGDTLWITSYFKCDSLYEQSTQKTDEFCIERYIFPLRFDYFDFTNSINLVPAADSIGFVTISGQVLKDITTQPSRVRQVLFEKVGKEVYFTIGLIPQTAGKFAVWSSKGPFGMQNSCDKATFDFQISNQDRHLDIYAEYRGLDAYTDISDRGYFFEVVQ